MPIRSLATLMLLGAIFAGFPRAQAEPPRGDVQLRLTFNPTPDPSWRPGDSVVLVADARRTATIGMEDIFKTRRFPGLHPRVASQQFDFTLPGVRVGEKVLVQGYMCAPDETDCFPSDRDNPPSCAVEVHILGNLRPKCQPVFTWTGGSAAGGVSCRAECRR